MGSRILLRVEALLAADVSSTSKRQTLKGIAPSLCPAGTFTPEGVLLALLTNRAALSTKLGNQLEGR